MKRFHHVIVAIDFTPGCRAALKEAVHRASVDQAAVTAVHVMDEFLVHELKRALSTTAEAINEDWCKRLKQFVEESDVGAGCAVEVRTGSPVHELMESCHAHKADLLVMGAKGSRSEPHRIGAVAAKCIRSAPVDVLIVRSEAQGPYKKVLACVDFSENAAKAVQCALHIAQQDGGTLDCLHVFQSALVMAVDFGGFAPAAMPQAVDAAGMERWKAELDSFLEPLTRKADGVTIKPVVAEMMNVREAILEHVIQHHCDLVVLGTRGKTNLRTLLIGTTAERIVQHLPCSILAVKPDEVVDAAG
jgi:universal stress protein E